MTDYRSRQIKAVSIHYDEAVERGDVEEKTIEEWHKLCDINWLRIVNASSTHNLVMVVDDDGYSRGLPWNPRAQYLSGYPLTDPIVGTVYFASLDFVGDGHDLVDIKPESAEWLKNPGHAEEYAKWLRAPENIEGVAIYRRRFPKP